eukprot:500487-Prorocentrum_lima.AAC.1
MGAAPASQCSQRHLATGSQHGREKGESAHVPPTAYHDQSPGVEHLCDQRAPLLSTDPPHPSADGAAPPGHYALHVPDRWLVPV